MRVKFYKLIEALKNSPARRNKFIILANVLALIINIGLWFFLYWQLKKIIQANPEFTTIPLHYNVFFGIDQFGKWYKAFILPLVGSVIFIVNFILAIFIYSKKSLASYFLAVASLLVQITLAASSLFIIMINL
jgi:hypothetical protein